MRVPSIVDSTRPQQIPRRSSHEPVAFASKYGDFERFPPGSSRPSRALPFSTKGVDAGDSGHPADDGRSVTPHRPATIVQALMEARPFTDHEESIEELHGKNEGFSDRVAEALASLTPTQLQIALMLSEGFNPSQIAASGVSSRVYVYKVISRLREILESAR